MYPYCVFIDAVTLQRLYIDERLTTVQVARHFQCSPSTVRRQLSRFGIPTRRRGPAPRRLRRVPGEPLGGWSADVAYVVGLIATDGNLGRGTTTISIVSKDMDLLETVRRCLDVTTAMKPHRGGYSNRCHRLTWRDRAFYDWLRSVGLSPAKSLTLGPLVVPDEYFADFFRGCIDGDGSILTYTDRYHTTKNERYVYDRLYVSIVSASPRFIEWLQATVCRLTGVSGSIVIRHEQGKNPVWLLRYAKAQSMQLLAWMYYAPNVPCLERKRITAERFLVPLGHSSIRTPGRRRIGWIYDTPRVEEDEVGWFLSTRSTRILVGGGVVELAFTAASKAAARKGVGVRIPSPPPLPSLTESSRHLYREASRGAVAQLGEHKAGSLGVRGSNPLSSTNFTHPDRVA
jgi:hypothetical protein